MAPGGGTCRRPRLPPKRVGNVGNLGNLEVDLYVKVLILLYIWKGCQDCQILSILNAGLGRPFQAHNHRSCRCGIKGRHPSVYAATLESALSFGGRSRHLPPVPARAGSDSVNFSAAVRIDESLGLDTAAEVISSRSAIMPIYRKCTTRNDTCCMSPAPAQGTICWLLESIQLPNFWRILSRVLNISDDGFDLRNQPAGQFSISSPRGFSGRYVRPRIGGTDRLFPPRSCPPVRTANHTILMQNPFET
jgi:hypothetical protein